MSPGREGPFPPLYGFIPALSGLMVLQAALVASAALQEAAMSAPFCSAAVHFRECQVERRKWRGSLTINI